CAPAPEIEAGPRNPMELPGGGVHVTVGLGSCNWLPHARPRLVARGEQRLEWEPFPGPLLRQRALSNREGASSLEVLSNSSFADQHVVIIRRITDQVRFRLHVPRQDLADSGVPRP